MAGDEPPGLSTDPAERMDDEPMDARARDTALYGSYRRDDFEFEYEVMDLPDIPVSIIDSDEQAESHLRSLVYLTGEEAAIQAHYDAELFKLDNWRARMLKPIQRRQEWHTGILRQYAEVCCTKTKRLVAGTLKLVKGRERVEIADEDRFCKRYESTPLVRLKASPDKKAVVEWMRSHDGVIPDHADIVRQPDHWEIEI